MAKLVWLPIALGIVVFGLDQGIKALFLSGWEWHSKCLSLVLAINYGVAFSLFSFLGEWLKYLQLLLLALVSWIAYKEKLLGPYRYEAALFFSAGLSNITDRFVVGGVVDYVYWHCVFDFAIFNLADLLIDAAVVSAIYRKFRNDKAKF